MKEPRTIRSLFSQAGFVAGDRLYGVIGDRYARVIRLSRRKKQGYVLNAGIVVGGGTISRSIAPAIFRWPVGASTSNLRDGESAVPGARPCL